MLRRAARAFPAGRYGHAPPPGYLRPRPPARSLSQNSEKEHWKHSDERTDLLKKAERNAIFWGCLMTAILGSGYVLISLSRDSTSGEKLRVEKLHFENPAARRLREQRENEKYK